MTAPDDGKLIFGRYTREECGLPPRGFERWRRAITPLRAGLVFAATAALAWLGGEALARWRADWLSALPARVHFADENDVPALLEEGRLYATALPDNHRMRRDLAMAAVTAAERMPRRLGYYATAADLFRRVPAEAIPEGERFGTEITAAGVHAETGDYASAFAALDRAEAGLQGLPEDEQRSRRLLLVNAKAYFLATADPSEGGDAKKALELARLVASSRDTLPGGGHASGNAAILDTLATAMHEAGDGRAASTQRLALGLADGAGLDVYLRHYDEFNNVARRDEGQH